MLHSQPPELQKSVPRRFWGQNDSCWGVTASKSYQEWETKVSEDALGLHAIPKAPLCYFSCAATSRHQRLLLGSLCLHFFRGVYSAQKKKAEAAKKRGGTDWEQDPGGWGGCLWLLSSWRSVTDWPLKGTRSLSLDTQTGHLALDTCWTHCVLASKSRDDSHPLPAKCPTADSWLAQLMQILSACWDLSTAKDWVPMTVATPST